MTNTSLYFPFDTLVVSMSEKLMPYGFDTIKNQLECDSLEKITTYFKETGRVLVWSDKCDTSIFQNSDVNIAFRAWHDFVHIDNQFPFTLQGEIDVCRIQQRQVKQALLPYTVEVMCLKLLEIEVIEQVKHYFNTGTYVKDQRKFTIDKLLNRI